ncbi:MAG TPA: hypothetical protein PLF25_10740 [Accumulibacter sp.]|nr:hypothetical protein [Accumulibacter sp.]
MRIDQAVLALSATHDYSRERELAYHAMPPFRQLLQSRATSEPATPAASGAAEHERGRLLTLIAALLTRMLALLAGRQETSRSGLQMALRDDGTTLGRSNVDQSADRWTLAWQAQREEIIREHESSDFTAHGLVLTADGRVLDFALDLSMCRDYQRVNQQTVSGALQLRDPLVVNFAGNALQLAGKRFAFDLDQDGRDEALYALGRGSAYLAIDRDSNGRINDGGELFGSTSGNAFADLAKLDDDGNHWIDEADAAFAKLRLWSGGERETTLHTLTEQGIGALYLGSVDTPFTITDPANRTLAQIRAAGLFLHENGSVGSLQQLDLAV